MPIKKLEARRKRDRRAMIAPHAVDSNSDHDENLVHHGQHEPGFGHVKKKGLGLPYEQPQAFA